MGCLLTGGPSFTVIRLADIRNEQHIKWLLVKPKKGFSFAAALVLTEWG